MQLKTVAVLALSSFLSFGAQANELRAALVELYPGHSTATLLMQYADECAPQDATKHSEIYKKWQKKQGLLGFRPLLNKTLGERDSVTLARNEQQTLLPKMRKQFAKCPSVAMLQEAYAGDMMDIRSSNPNAHQTVSAALGTASSVAVSPARLPKPVNSAAAVSAGSKRPLEGVYMNQIYTFNGFDFESYAVFKDGTISDDLNAAFGGGTMRTGRWQRSGNGFSVTWDNGKRETMSGSTFYRTFPAGSGEALSGKYVFLSTGGNTSLGGNVMTFDASTIYFQPNGQFSVEASRGGSSSAGAGYSSNGSRGRYNLKGHTITFQYDSGQTVTTGFYYFPESGRKTVGTIGIGNKIYSLKN
jgi:hypothetical protein